MSWQQLKSILDDNRRFEREDRRPPEACPIDGAVLDVHPDGRRNCPMGNYQWPRDGRILP